MLFLLLFICKVSLESISPGCELELLKMYDALKNDIVNYKPSNYTAMIMSSGLKLNNLGSYDDCNKQNGARYTLIQLSFDTYFAICLPAVCSKSDILHAINGNFTKIDSPKLTTQLIHFPKNSRKINARLYLPVPF